jgi:carboxypeptidase family protein
MKHIFTFAVVLFMFSLTAIAQVTDATLKLSVADEQSNSVGGVSVEITNEETGVKRAAVTDNNGQVTVAGLPSGSYAVSLKANGFKSFTQKNLKLNVGQMAELKIQPPALAPCRLTRCKGSCSLPTRSARRSSMAFPCRSTRTSVAA